jgi:undecaprenyl-diphosphatase
MHSGRWSRVRRLTRAVVYALVVAVPLGALAFLVRTKFGPLVHFDEDMIVRATNVTRAHPGFRSVAAAWELVSQPWVVYALVGLPVCAFAWFRLHLRTRAAWALATMAIGWAIATGVKGLVQRARPVVEDPFANHAGYSFPSGHATNSAIVVTVVAILLHPVLTSGARRALLGGGAIWLLVTCADRVFMGAHFPSDVAAGVLLGCGVCAASYAGYSGWSPPTPADTSKGLT